MKGKEAGQAPTPHPLLRLCLRVTGAPQMCAPRGGRSYAHTLVRTPTPRPVSFGFPFAAPAQSRRRAAALSLARPRALRPPGYVRRPGAGSRAPC